MAKTCAHSGWRAKETLADPVTCNIFQGDKNQIIEVSIITYQYQEEPVDLVGVRGINTNEDAKVDL